MVSRGWCWLCMKWNKSDPAIHNTLHTNSNTRPAPCQNLFGLLTLHTRVLYPWAFGCLSHGKHSQTQQKGRLCDCVCVCDITFLISLLLLWSRVSVCHFLALHAPPASSILSGPIKRVTLHSSPVQSSPVELGFKPALTPSPTWSSGWVLLGCWLTSAERWSGAKPAAAPARESGPVPRPWWGRGPGAGRCWQVEARAVQGPGVESAGREPDQTIVRCRRRWGCSGWTGEAGAEVEWRRQGGGTGSPCGRPER